MTVAARALAEKKALQASVVTGCHASQVFEAFEHLFSFAGRAMRNFGSVVHAFMGAVISASGLCDDRFDVAA
jgi:hypothetical protein